MHQFRRVAPVGCFIGEGCAPSSSHQQGNFYRMSTGHKVQNRVCSKDMSVLTLRLLIMLPEQITNDEKFAFVLAYVFDDSYLPNLLQADPAK